MKMRWDLIFSLGLLVSFFLPWLKPNLLGLPVGSGFDLARHPDIPLFYLYIVPALAILVIISSFLTNFHNRWFRIMAGLIPLGAAGWLFNALNGLFGGEWAQTFQAAPAFFDWGLYLGVLFSLLLLLQGVIGKARTS